MNQPDSSEGYQLACESLEWRIRQDGQALRKLCDAWAEAGCPVKVGEMMIIPRGSSEFVGHNSRVIRRTAARHRFDDTWCWKLQVRVLTKALAERKIPAIAFIEIPMTDEQQPT